jgi:hypothetical protein
MACWPAGAKFERGYMLPHSMNGVFCLNIAWHKLSKGQVSSTLCNVAVLCRLVLSELQATAQLLV